MRLALLAVSLIAAASAFAFRPNLAGTATMWLAIVVPYLALSALSIYRMWDDGTLIDWLKPRWGDVSIGVPIAALLLMASWAARSILAPAGTPRQAWLMRIYMQFGSAESIQNSVLLTLAVILIPVLEELVWRQMVLKELQQKFVTRRVWPFAAVLYAVAYLPSAFTLADPVAGPNPLLFVAALGCGIFWSFIASLTGRLPPVIISHVAFIYFTATQFRWPGM